MSDGRMNLRSGINGRAPPRDPPQGQVRQEPNADLTDARARARLNRHNIERAAERETRRAFREAREGKVRPFRDPTAPGYVSSDDEYIEQEQNDRDEQELVAKIRRTKRRQIRIRVCGIGAAHPLRDENSAHYESSDEEDIGGVSGPATSPAAKQNAVAAQKARDRAAAATANATKDAKTAKETAENAQRQIDLRAARKLIEDHETNEALRRSLLTTNRGDDHTNPIAFRTPQKGLPTPFNPNTLGSTDHQHLPLIPNTNQRPPANTVPSIQLNAASPATRALLTGIDPARRIPDSNTPASSASFGTPSSSPTGTATSENMRAQDAQQGPDARTFNQHPAGTHDDQRSDRAQTGGQPNYLHPNAYRTADDVATLKRQGKRLDRKSEAIKTTLATSDPLQTARCLKEISMTGSLHSNRPNYDLIFDIAEDKANDTIGQKITDYRTAASATGAAPSLKLWQEIQVMIMTEMYSDFYITKLHDATQKIRLSQRKYESVANYMDTSKCILDAITAIYDLSDAGPRETISITTAFLNKWVSGLSAHAGIRHILIMISTATANNKSITWEEVTAAAKASEAVDTSAQNAPPAGHRGDATRAAEKLAAETLAKTKELHRLATNAQRAAADTAATATRKAKDDHRRLQQEIASVHSDLAASKRAMTTSLQDQRRQQESFQANVRDQANRARDSRRSHRSRSRSPKRESTRPTTSYRKAERAPPRKRSRSPDRRAGRAAPAMAMGARAPMSDALRARVLTGKCFRCDQVPTDGHIAANCKARCPECGKAHPNRHTDGCTVGTGGRGRPTSGNGRGR